ncbi:MAG TPA: efflux RND transporter periplasmic adaptor subunit [Pirellulales bacterium]|jgi:RND family efflux transporter MFP subunit|nr:efflux RND transporter periplasmic adaptor subunit [Pirellulales bacterium]
MQPTLPDPSQPSVRPAKKQRLFPFAGRIGVGLLLVAGLVFGIVYLRPHPKQSAASDGSADRSSAADRNLPVVKVGSPKLNKTELVRSITQPAFIEGLTKADLMSRVAGVVKTINKDIGDSIKQGDVLIEIDAPDLAKTIQQKSALVDQAAQDLRSAQANVKVVEAAEKSALSAVAEKEADIDRYQAKLKFLNTELGRFGVLVNKDAVLANIMDEKKLEAESAQAAVKAAKAAVATANSEHDQASAKLAEAVVDVDVKKARLAVAKADREQAEIQFEFTKIRAPFDGIVIGRNVDPGAFVQNASTGKSIPLLSVVQIDKVTAVMWVPERDAPYVTKSTEAELHLDALDGKVIHSKVDRYSNWLDPEHSRDMRVEVDLTNNSGPNHLAGAIRPGMYGSMTLVLQRFDKAFLLPESAVFQQNKKSYILEVIKGIAHRTAVRVEFEDGAKMIVCKVKPHDSNDKDVCEKLTGSESIVFSGQSDIADGQRVKPVKVTW